MIGLFVKIYFCILIFISFLGNASEPRSLAPELKKMSDWLQKTHPDFSASVAGDEFNNKLKVLSKKKYSGSASAWQSLALLNPILNDGHMGVRYPANAYNEYISSGGATFNLAVTLTDENDLRLDQGFEDLKSGTQIHSINGISTEKIVEDLLARMHGDSPELRRELISRRFKIYFWSMYGNFESYQFTAGPFDNTKRYTLSPDSERVTLIEEPKFQFSIVNSDTALLKINTFEKELQTEFGVFIKDSFSKLSELRINNLFIDLRDNGGGAHDLSDILLNYITDKKVSSISKVKARVVEENQHLFGGAKLGSVIATPYFKWFTPTPELKNRFDGSIYVIIGKYTYSQAIVFASQVQDYDLGKLVGESTGGRANQTAQVQVFNLDDSKIQVLAPIYILIRPSGDESYEPLKPDLSIKYDNMTSENFIKTTLNMIQK